MLLAGAGVLIHDQWGLHRMNALIAAAEKEGPVTYEQIEAARRVWPDEENGALVIWALRDKLKTPIELRGQVSTEPSCEAWITMPVGFKPPAEGLAIEVVNQLGTSKVWVAEQIGDPLAIRIVSDQPNQLVTWWDPKTKNLSSDLETAQNIPPGERWNLELHTRLRGYLNDRMKVLGGIDRATKMKGGRLPFTIDSDPMLSMNQGLGSLRHAAQLIALRFLERLMAGEGTVLVPAVDAQMALQIMLADEPCLVGSLLRIAICDYAISMIQQGCGLSELSIAELDELTRQIAPMDIGDRLYWGMIGERAMMIGQARFLRGDSPKPNPKPPHSDWGTADKLFYRGRIAWNVDAAWAWQSHRISYAQNSEANLAAVHQAANEDQSWLEAPYYHFACVFSPVLERPFQFDVNLTARTRCTLAALAAERYRLQTGSFPESLDQLVPGYLEAVPIDPFDAQPLRYLRELDRVVIYSIGMDEVDHHAQLDPQRQQSDGLDTGFILLPPERRNRPAGPAPSAQPAAEGVMPPLPGS